MSELTKALAALQANLPRVGKDQKANAGQYSYTYADLAAVSAAVIPLLSKHGLAFIAKPTWSGERFVLAYSLLHESGQREDGEYPLPDRATPQQLGSAITYGRRYCLCAVTGVAPEDDDDDAAAAAHRKAEPPPPPNPLFDARQAVTDAWTATHDGIWSPEGAAQAYAEWSQGELIADATAEQLNRFADSLREPA